MSTNNDTSITSSDPNFDGSSQKQSTPTAASTLASSSNTGFGGALARTTARAAALYFSRPVRLFRPQKVSPWTTLRGLASKQGATLSPQFLINIFRTQGWQIFQHHFLPPLIVNTLLGTLLFTSYTTSQYIITLHPLLAPHTTLSAAMAGACAGAVHGMVGAPLDNVARYLEKGDTSWRQAWAEAFHVGRDPPSPPPAGANTAAPSSSQGQPTAPQLIRELKKQDLWPPPTLSEARAAKSWLWEWRHLAHRGWAGWKWGLGRDITGFSIFFSLFDLSRRTANYLAVRLTPEGWESPDRDGTGAGRRPGLARAAHGLTLVGGGVVGGLAYEGCARPWEAARALWVANKLLPEGERRTLPQVLVRGLRENGVRFFFRSPGKVLAGNGGGGGGGGGRWYWRALTTLGRVGPWGVAFLVWEGIGGTVIG